MKQQPYMRQNQAVVCRDPRGSGGRCRCAHDSHAVWDFERIPGLSPSCHRDQYSGLADQKRSEENQSASPKRNYEKERKNEAKGLRLSMPSKQVSKCF